MPRRNGAAPDTVLTMAERKKGWTPATRPEGFLLVDDLDLTAHEHPELRDGLASARERLVTHPDLICAELTFASGVIVARRRKGDR